MPHYDFRLSALMQTLENDTYLLEAMFFPEVSCFGDDLGLLQGKLQNHVQRVVESAPAVQLYRRHACGTPETGSVVVVVDPPPHSLVWREPVSLTFHMVRWSHGEDAHIAFIPALGIEVVAGKPDELEAMIPAHIRAALMRDKASASLQRLVRLQRCRALQVEQLPFTAKVLSPKQLVQEEERKQNEKKSVLEEVATNLTKEELPEAFEVRELVEQIAEILTGRNPRSVLLVGPSGAGKTAAVYQLVRQREQFGWHQTPFWATSGSRLVAGMSGFGMWEQRCQELWREAAKTKAILHPGNLVELMGVGKSEYRSQGVAAFLRPYIGRGELLVIAECTPEQLALIEREDPQLLQVFFQIKVEEPSPARGAAILASYALASKSRGDLPIEPEALETLDRLHRRYATYSAYPGRPLRFLKNLLHDQPKGRPIHTSEVTAAFARETGLPLILLEESARLDLDEARRWFGSRVIGQPEAVELVVDLLATVKAGLTRPRKPIASLLFIGPTGVGKTEMAKSLAEFLFGNPQRLTRLDMSEYADPEAVQRLIGGVFGSEGVLTAKIREQPFSVVLLDEFEKAHPLFFDLLLQMLGEGRLTDAAGRLADFCNAVVIMTSNLGAESFQQGAFGFGRDGQARQEARQHFVDEVRSFVRPELFNRIDRIVSFAPLDQATTLHIARRQLDLLQQRDGVRYRGVNLELGPEVADFLGKKGYDPRYGPRPLKRTIERELLAPLADQMNGYSAEAALNVKVRVEEERFRITVRARTDESGNRGSGAECALRWLDLRRRLQRLQASPAVLEMHNEIYRLEKMQTLLQARDRQPPVDFERLGRLSKWKTIAGSLQALEQMVTAHEDEALLGLYGQGPFDPPRLTTEAEAAEKAWNEVLLLLYFLNFEDADHVTLAVFSEQPEYLFLMADAYYRLAIQAKGHVEVWQFLPGRPGRNAADEEDKSHPERRQVLTPDALFDLSGAVAVRHWDRDQKTFLPEATLADARKGVVGIALAIRGHGAYPRLAPEAGLHQFHTGKSPAQCLVDTSNRPLVATSHNPPAAYEPPEGIDRRGAIGNQEKRRIYHVNRGQVEDPYLREKLSLPRGGLLTLLDEAIDKWLVSRAWAQVHQ